MKYKYLYKRLPSLIYKEKFLQLTFLPSRKVSDLLVDVRFSPTGELMRWRQIYLKTLLREKYHHVAQLGNRSFRERRNQIHNLDLGIKILVSFNENAVLMCECADSKECHRLLIAEELRRKGFEVEELENWKLGKTSL